jgi:signal recognition particle subunit SRP54
VFENLNKKLQNVFKKITGQGRLSESNISEALKEVRLSLLEADANYKIVKNFIEDVKKRALGQEVLQSITPGQQIIKIINDELVCLMRSEKQELIISPKAPTVIMLTGLQGGGKTTTCAKLAKYLTDKDKKVVMTSTDIYRPAAQEQLKTLGEKLNIPVLENKQNKDIVSLAQNALEEASDKLYDYLLVDTAGRTHIDKEMMRELSSLKNILKPHEILLIVDAMTGQEAVNIAKEFEGKMNLTGIILTKLDGDARGGAAISIKAITNKPIKFVGVGEKLTQIEKFYPERIASRILGMGDIVSLVEKAGKTIAKEEQKALEKKLLKNKFNLEDFLWQMGKMKEMGSFSEILAMLPGVPSNISQSFDEKQMIRIEAIIKSMTLKERRNPNIIDGSRRKRIARGSGTTVQDINQLLKQFEQSKKMMKNINRFAPILKRFGA